MFNKFFVFILLSFVFNNTNADQKKPIHVLIDFEDVLVKKIPKRLKEDFLESEVISDNDQYFRIYKNAFKAVQALKKNHPELRIEILDKTNLLSNKMNSKLLKDVEEKNQLKVNYIISNIYSSLDDYSTVLNEEEAYFFTDFRNSHHDLMNHKNFHEIPIGKSLYQFENYVSAKLAKDKLKDASLIDFYPENEAEYFKEKNRLLYYLFNLHVALLNNVKDLGISENTILSLENEEFFLKKINRQPLKDFRWIYKDQEIEGCGFYNYETSKYVDSKVNSNNKNLTLYSLDNCLKNKDIRFNLKLNNDNKLVCYGQDRESGFEISQSFQLFNCVNKENSFYAFSHLEKNKCNLYLKEALTLVKSVPLSLCAKTYVLYFPEIKKSLKFDSFPGIEKISLKELFQRIQDPPTKENPYKLWFPHLNRPEVGYSYEECKGHGTDFAIDVNNPKCLPDTLYSWGPDVKLKNLEQWMGNGKWVSEFRPLFTIPSPFSTFGYGPISIRIKLKRNLKWKVNDFGCSGTKEEYKNTIYVRNKDYFDVVICSPEVIESWSVGYKEHYDEIIKDKNWIQKNDCSSDKCYIYQSAQFCSDSNMRCFNRNIDNYDFAERTFKSNLEVLLDFIESEKSKLYCNPSVKKEDCTIENHFQTNHPIYFNED